MIAAVVHFQNDRWSWDCQSRRGQMRGRSNNISDTTPYSRGDQLNEMKISHIVMQKHRKNAISPLRVVVGGTDRNGFDCVSGSLIHSKGCCTFCFRSPKQHEGDEEKREKEKVKDVVENSGTKLPHVIYRHWGNCIVTSRVSSHSLLSVMSAMPILSVPVWKICPLARVAQKRRRTLSFLIGTRFLFSPPCVPFHSEICKREWPWSNSFWRKFRTFWFPFSVTSPSSLLLSFSFLRVHYRQSTGINYKTPISLLSTARLCLVTVAEKRHKLEWVGRRKGSDQTSATKTSERARGSN